MRNTAIWVSTAAIFAMPTEHMFIVSESLGSLSRLVGISVGMFWLATVLGTGELRSPHPVHLVILLFFAWNALTLFWSIDVERTVGRLESYLQKFVFCLLVWDLYRTRAALRIGLQAYVLGTYVPIISLLWNFVNGVHHEGMGSRYSATGAHPNGLGLIMALSLPIAWYLAATPSDGKHGRLIRMLNYAHIPIVYFCIALTASRGSLLSSFPMLLLVLASLSRLSFYHKVVICAVFVIGFSLLIPAIPQESFHRLGSTTTEIQSLDLNGRVAIWSQGLAVFLEHPLFGVGCGAFNSAVPLGKSPHNTPLSLLVDTGLIGFALFAGIMGLIVYQASRTPGVEMLCWLTILLIWCIGATIHNWEHTKHTWLIMSFVTIGANLPVRPVQLHNVAEHATT